MRILTLCSLALLTAVPAIAQPDVSVRRISYADLDLASNAGRTTLRHRVDHAISEVCGKTDPQTLADRPAASKCGRLAEESVSRQMTVAVAKAITGHPGNELLLAAR